MNDNVVVVFFSSKDGEFICYLYVDMLSDFNVLEWDWYKEVMVNKGKIIVIEFYEFILLGKMVVIIVC